jgi:hypothetical protein
LAIESPIERPCASFILLAWNGNPDAMLACVLPDFPAAVPLITDDAVGPAFWTTAPTPLHRPVSHELWEDHGLMPLTRRQYQGEELTIALCAEMHFGAESTLAAA